MFCEICEREHDGDAPVCFECRDASVRALGLLPEYSHGYAAGQRAAIGDELLRDLLQLAHPDRHPPERQALATRATAQLLSIREAR